MKQVANLPILAQNKVATDILAKFKSEYFLPKDHLYFSAH